MVAPPFTAVAADNMNIFYAGVDNPISVSSAGFSPSQLKISISGCGAAISKDAKGNYIVTAKSTGTCMVSVAANTPEGIKQQGAPKIFRVKGIPPPVLKIGGKLATTNLEFTRSEFASIGGVGAESPGFMFPVNMVVKSFSIELLENGTLVPYNCPTNNLTLAAKTALSRVRVGQRVFFENIKVQTPTGIISLPPTQIKMRS